MAVALSRCIGILGDAAGIDDVIQRVEQLVVPLENVPFDLFDKRYQTSWEGVMGKFDDTVKEVRHGHGCQLFCSPAAFTD